jgi:SAM-dependent methyltransferase
MHLDVLDLRSFYYRSPLGRAAQKAVRDQVLALWPSAPGQTVVGFGFAVPLLRPYLAEARRVIGLMPAPQGVMPWPAGMPNVSVLCEEVMWPLASGSVDRLILLHGLETSENPSAVLREAARVLADNGRALFIVPNRAGLWARSEKTPFGFGRPYTPGQLDAQLRRHAFVPESLRAALFQPPSAQRFWLRTGQFWERMGQRLPARIAGGVLMVEASKQVHASPRRGTPATAARPIRVLDGLATPGPEPA